HQNLEHSHDPVGHICRYDDRGSAQTVAAGKGAQQSNNLVQLRRGKPHDCLASIDQLAVRQRKVALLPVQVSAQLIERDGAFGDRSHLIALSVYGMGEGWRLWPQLADCDSGLSRFQRLNQPAIRDAASHEFCALFQHRGEQGIGTVVDQRYIIEVDYEPPVAKLLEQVLPDFTQLPDPWAHELPIHNEPPFSRGFDDRDFEHDEPTTCAQDLGSNYRPKTPLGHGEFPSH